MECRTVALYTLCTEPLYLRKHKKWGNFSDHDFLEMPSGGAWDGYIWRLPSKRMEKMWEERKMEEDERWGCRGDGEIPLARGDPQSSAREVVCPLTRVSPTTIPPTNTLTGGETNTPTTKIPTKVITGEGSGVQQQQQQQKLLSLPSTQLELG